MVSIASFGFNLGNVNKRLCVWCVINSMNKKKGSIVILTGAGISAESGIQTFRGADGLWEGHHIEEVASPEGFVADPNLVLNFYN
jgi:NAD-dependent SIR2 family protein deacetylase